MISAVRMEDPAKLTDVISANLQLSIEESRTAGDLRPSRAPDPHRRCARHRNRKLNVDRTIQSRVKRQNGKGAERVLPQREDQSHPEGTGPGEKSEFDELKKKIESAGMTKEVKTRRCRN